MELFQTLAMLMSLYGLWGLFTGRVWAKDGISAREIHKADEPKTFWVVCLIYVFMGAFLYFAMQARHG